MKEEPMLQDKSVAHCCNSKTTTKNADARHIMLVGNPNCGKSTLFNRLCNVRVRTGNYPGVTVSRHVGDYKKGVQLIDIPGIYSLNSSTVEEQVATAELLDNDAECIVNVIDSTCLERSLYLTLELKMLGIPLLVVLNMWDEAKKDNINIDIDKLSKILDCKIIPISATTGEGVTELEDYIKTITWGIKQSKYIGSQEINSKIEELAALVPELYKPRSMFYAKSILQEDKIPQAIVNEVPSFVVKASEIRNELISEGHTIHEIIANDRYKVIEEIIEKVQTRNVKTKTLTALVDKIVLNRYLALPIFFAIMFLVYYVSVSWLGAIVTDWTNDEFFGEMVQPAVSDYLTKHGASDWLSSLVSDGIVGGVGTVLGFVPQMIILFTLLSLLEECGYMTRAAFILDRLFQFFGLSGRAFIPYLIASGCGVPGLMTVRTLSSESERRITLFTGTMIPCGAKLPVIIIFASAIFSDYSFFAGGMYLMGVFIIILSASIMKKFSTFKPSLSPLMLELPHYHIPSARVVALTVYHRSKAFIIKAGTVIFMSVTLIWFLSSYGWNSEKNFFEQVEDTEQSILVRVAKPVSVIFAPIGSDDYRTTVSIISGLVAKENIVGSLAVFVGVEDEEDEAFENALSNSIFHLDTDKEKGLLAALAYVVFNLFTIPCFAAVGVLKREIGDTKLFLGAIAYQLVFAYSLAMIIYQFGMWVHTSVFTIWTLVSIILVMVVLYLLFIKKTSQTEQQIQFVMREN